MLPTLAHIPPRSIVRIPGSRTYGSRRAQVVFGLDNNGDGAGGLPSGQEILDYWQLNNSPVWFAVSDFGAGYIPWGFWQVALYPTGQMPVPNPYPASLSTYYVEVPTTVTKYDVASILWGVFSQFIAFEAGAFPIVAQWRLSRLPIFGSPPGEFGQVVLTAPAGMTRIQGYYSGPQLMDHGLEIPTLGFADGWDNPLFLALWSPGNRAILRAVARAAPPGYPGYPYPGDPPGTVG